MTRPSSLARAAALTAAGVVTGVVLLAGLTTCACVAAAKRIADGINEAAGGEESDDWCEFCCAPGHCTWCDTEEAGGDDERIDGDGYVFTLPNPSGRLDSAIDLYFEDVR